MKDDVIAELREAEAYLPAPDLCVITSYFNPLAYRTKPENFEIFAAKLRASGVPLVVAECAFFDRPFTFSTEEAEVRVRSSSILFQKERLLNLALLAVPKRYTKIAFLDADVLFTNPRWALDTSEALERFPIVQPWSTGHRLARGARAFRRDGRSWPSFGAVWQTEPVAARSGVFDRHGHTGFGWAARRELLERHGIYDGAIGGHADHLISHAATGDWASPCLLRLFGVATPFQAHYRRWARSFYADVSGAVGAVPGALLHLWHGELSNRRYFERARELASLGFDPATDLAVNASGAWEWATDKPALHAFAIEFFRARREDETGDGLAPRWVT